MTYMVVERFKDRNPKPIYQRLSEKGRMMPEGLVYVNSWIADDFSVCYQLMETKDVSLFDEWISHWKDLMEFEVFPVITSAEARALTEGA